MSDFEQELAQISQESIGEEEEKGELTPEILEHYFGKFSADTDAPVH